MYNYIIQLKRLFSSIVSNLTSIINATGSEIEKLQDKINSTLSTLAPAGKNLRDCIDKKLLFKTTGEQRKIFNFRTRISSDSIKKESKDLTSQKHCSQERITNPQKHCRVKPK